MSDVTTYVFRDGHTYAIRQGKVIAADVDPAEVERQVLAYHEDPYGVGYEHPIETTCPHCGGLTDGSDPSMACVCPGQHHAPAAAPTQPMPMPDPSVYAKVVTPNGLKGTVLGKVAGLWGDEVTVRLENGRIVKLPTGTVLNGTEQKTAAAKPNLLNQMEHRLAAIPVGTRESLSERLRELAWLKDKAASLIREGASHNDSVRLDMIVVTADVERSEVSEALAYLDEAERIEAPRAFTMQAADRTSAISKEDGSWLDDAYNKMIREAEAQDFTKLMDEGPEALVAELPDSALADTGVTRQTASAFIAEKTAGVDRQIATPYMDTFLARVEQVRRAELSTRTQTHHKEAAAQEDVFKDVPDDALWL